MRVIVFTRASESDLRASSGRVDGHRLEFLDTVICANYAGAYESVVPYMATVYVRPPHMLDQ